METGQRYRTWCSCCGALLALFALFPGPVPAAEAKYTTPTAVFQKTTEAFRIDGKLEEPAWQKATVIDRFLQREPDEGQPVSERTEVRLLYDEKYLYIGFRCYDREPRRIVANEMRRDISLLNNDCVEIYLDTYRDGRTAFCFITNPLGAQRDGLITTETDETQQNWDWNGIWQNACRIDGEGWTAEIAIPFQTLRYTRVKSQVWAANFARLIPRKREEAFWSPIWREYGLFGKFRMSAFGRLEGLNNLSRPRTWEIKPYLLPRLQSETTGARLSPSLNLGLDGKVRLTSNLTADITVNTDFAQVEADQEQVNLTRFELFFPEKRDFFLEGAGLFRAGERNLSFNIPPNLLFFSRRIGLSPDSRPVPILAGAKVTGRINRFNLGFMNILSDRTEYDEEGEHVFIPRTNFTVLRLQQNLFSRSTIGFVGLNKESLDDESFNRCFALDGQFFLGKYLQADGFVAKSFTPGQRGRDWAASGDLLFNNDFWYFLVSQNATGENFNDELGFWPRTGARMTHVSASIAPRPHFLGIRQVFLFNDFIYIAEHDGQVQTRTNATGFYSLFQDGATLLAFLGQNLEHLDEDFEITEGIFIPYGDHRFTSFYSEYQSDQSRFLSGKVTLNAGEFYDGHIMSYGIGANLKAGRRTTINLLLNRNEVRLAAGSFDTMVVSARLLYTFTPRLFAKIFVQYNSEENRLMGNILFHLIHRPGSDLFFVYNQEWGRDSGRFQTQNRALILKFNYLFHL